MDLSKPQFKSAQLASVTGLSPETLQTWANRGLLGASASGRTGSGQRRLYSASDVIRIRMMQELIAFGLPISVASEMCSGDLSGKLGAITKELQSGRGQDAVMVVFRARGGYKAEFASAKGGALPWGAIIAEMEGRGACQMVPVGKLIAETIQSLQKVADAV